jgi:hypothetical protein
MSRKFKIRDQEAVHFVTFTIIQWLDIFIRAEGRSNPNNTRYQFWQQHSHPIELNTNEKLDQLLDYIHKNPVVAGMVGNPEEYLYSSAGNYAKSPENVLEVMLI